MIRVAQQLFDPVVIGSVVATSVILSALCRRVNGNSSRRMQVAKNANRRSQPVTKPDHRHAHRNRAALLRLPLAC